MSVNCTAMPMGTHFVVQQQHHPAATLQQQQQQQLPHEHLLYTSSGTPAGINTCASVAVTQAVNTDVGKSCKMIASSCSTCYAVLYVYKVYTVS